MLQQPVAEACDAVLPTALTPRKGRFSLVDREKVYCAEPFDGEDIFDARSISREAGALVVVRPDQYVAAVLALDDHSGLEEFFAAFMCDGPDERKQS